MTEPPQVGAGERWAPSDPDRARTWEAPSLEGRHVYLRAVTQRDYPLLRMLETSSDLAPRWRFRGATPSPESWAQSIWAGMLAQFLIVGRRDDEPLGIVGIHNANPQSGFAYLQAARFDLSKHSPAVMLGLALFLEYAFACWNLRKLYMEVPEYNLPQIGRALRRLVTIEGQLKGHSVIDGRAWDEYILAIYRDAWREHGRRVLAMERDMRTVKRMRIWVPGSPIPGLT
jgi:hypothetical protein